MRYVDVEDIGDLGLGATILGSGGGGSPEYDMVMAEKQIMEYGKVCLTTVDELQESDFVLPIAFVGAPLVALECFPSGFECDLIVDEVERLFGRRPTHLMAAEIGGANALCPFLFAGRLGLPILDADTLGRAFPELQMSSCNLFNVSIKPAFIADSLGNHVAVNTVSADHLESIARKVVVAMGSSALVGIYLMDGITAKRAVIRDSVSAAMYLGKSVRQARQHGRDPIEALCVGHGARLLGCGIIDAIEQSIDEGFLHGAVSILVESGSLRIAYQNEYLKVERADGTWLSVTPEIIAILDTESGGPITSERLLYGMRVSVLAFPAPPIWMSEGGLQLVGPEYFGYIKS